MLDVKSDTSGILIPRMTEAQRDAINSPAIGLLIFQTDNTTGFYYYDGSSWGLIGTGAFAIDDLSDGKSEGSSIFLGLGSGDNDDGSNSNVAVGIDALNTNTSGWFNTAIGYQALFTNTTGSSNTANGNKTLYSNTTGYNNTATGWRALNKNTTGYHNTANGYTALNNNIAGNKNTANGCWALFNNTSGSNNTASGYSALNDNTTGYDNTANGFQASFWNTTGFNNTTNGGYANYFNQEGSNNTILGYKAGMGTSFHNKFGNVFLGYMAGYSEEGSDKLYIENSSSTSPLIYGEFDNNILRVNGTLDINNAYQFPMADGATDQIFRTDGSGTLSWSFISINDLTDGKTGGGSIFLGSSAGTNDDGSDNNNVALGISALKANTTGSYNSAIGWHALLFNTTGNNNVALGSGVLGQNTTGIRNVAIGNGANFWRQGGSYNTIIGYEAGSGIYLNNKSGNVFLGYQAGYNETGDNKLYIENSNSSTPLIYGEFDTDLLRVNGTLDINSAYQFPTNDGTSGQVLQTNGSGMLSWISTGGGSGVTEINDLTDGISDGSSVFLGSGAGVNDDGTDNKNVAVGIGALNSNSSGFSNTSVGFQALNSNTNNAYNNAFGHQALYSNTGGSNNIGVGHQALYSNISGSHNIAVGNETLFSNTTGISNTAYGGNALFANTTGNYNTANGNFALYSNNTGIKNTAFGASALINNSIGNYNTALGYRAGGYKVEGSNNTFIGYEAGMGSSPHNKSGNVFLGYKAGLNEIGDNKLYIENSNSSAPLIYGEFDNNLLRINGTLDVNNAYQFPTSDGTTSQVLQTDGSGVLSWSTVSGGGVTEINDLTDGISDGSSVFLGLGAGANDDGSANKNTAVGIDALNTNISGIDNTATGYQTLISNTTGDYNTANGNWALYSNISGSYNTANGKDALFYNTTGSNNTANGCVALLHNTTGVNNTANGSDALSSNTEGNQNSANGSGALFSNTEGNCNTVFGFNASFYNQTGSYNTIVGCAAGVGTPNHNISGNVFLGYMAGHDEAGDNKLYIENSAISTPLIYGEFDNDLITINGNLGIGTTSFGNGTATLAFLNGTAPTASITDGILLYSEDESASSELKVRDEAGNVTTLSPHNFSMINKSEPMAWSFYSENEEVDKKINVDMLRAIRLIEEVTGEKLAYVQNIDDESGKINSEENTLGIIQQQQNDIDDLLKVVTQQQNVINEMAVRIEKLEAK